MAATNKNKAIAAAKLEAEASIESPEVCMSDFDVVAMPFAFASDFKKAVAIRRIGLMSRKDITDYTETITATNQLVWFAKFTVIS